MGSKCVVFTKDDANKALDNINMWINNCDTKVSVILGLYAVIFTIGVSTDFLNLHKTIINSILSNPSVGNVIFGILFLITIVAFVVGLLILIKVLIPNIITKKDNNKKFESVTFYGSIAENFSEYKTFRKKVYEIKDEKQILDDLLFQVYSAAKICNK